MASTPALRTSGNQISDSAGSCPIASGSSGIWNDAGTPKWRKTDGSDITIGGGGSTANWTFSGNNATLTGAGTMGIGLSVATAIQIGASGVASTFLGQIAQVTTSIGTTTTTVGESIQNTTASLVGAQQQYSPLIELLGHGWQAGGVNADQTVKAAFQQRPQPGTSLAATSRVVLSHSPGTGSYADTLFFDTDTTNITTISYAGATSTSIAFGSSLSLHSNSGIIRADTMWPQSDGQQMGEPTVPLGWTFSGKAYYGRLQTPAFGATMNIDPSLGEHVKIVLTANLTNWTISAPPAGAGNSRQLIVLELVQDAGGSKLIGTPPASIKWLSTSYLGSANHNAPVLSTGSNAKDYFFLMSDNDAGTYVEISRNMNL